MLSLWRTLSLRHLRRRAGRTALVLASVALGVAAWTATGSLDGALQRALRESATPLAGAADLYVSNGDVGLKREVVARLARLPGVLSAQPVVIERVRLPGLGGQTALMLGVDLEALRSGQGSPDVKLRGFDAAALLKSRLTGQPPVLVGEALAQALPKGAARLEIDVAGGRQRLTRAGSIVASGALASLGGHVLVLEGEVAARLAGRPGLVNRIDLKLRPGTDVERGRGEIVRALDGSASVATPQGQDERVLDLLAGLNVGFSVCGSGALALGLFLIYNVLSVSLAERQREIGIARAIGASRLRMRALYMGEAALVGLAGAGLGLPLGWGLARFSLGPMQRILSDLFLPMQAQAVDFSAARAAAGMFAGVATVLLAALAPIWRATSPSPGAALRLESPAEATAANRWLGVAGIVLVALGLVIFMERGHLPPRMATYGALVAIVLGTLLLMPVVTIALAGLLRLSAGRVLGVSGRLAADELAREPGRTGLTIAALLAGVALVLQTGGVIHGNESAIRAWVDQGVAGDLFITSGGPLSSSGQLAPMPEELAEELKRALPGLQVVPMRFRSLNWEHARQSTRVLLMAMDARAYYDANAGRTPVIPSLPLFRQLTEPGTAIVSENFAQLHQVHVGDTITLPGRDGPVALRVIGAIPDYSSSQGKVHVDRVSMGHAFGAELVDVFNTYLPTGASTEDARERILHAPWAAEHSLVVLTREEMRAHILGMIGRFYRVAYVQELVAGLVAALGVVGALLISVIKRQRELGLLRSVGATQGQVLATVLAEALLMAAIGSALGLLAGVALEWYVLRVILLEEAGFAFPVQIPWRMAGAIAIVVLAMAACAGLGPGVRAARMRIAEAVAYE